MLSTSAQLPQREMPMSIPSKAESGFSDHEVLLEIRDDLKQHIKDSNAVENDIRENLAKRPTRTEIVLWVTGVGSIVATVLAIGG